MNFNWLTAYPIAHRGLHKGREVPENSLAAFQAAIDKGYPIELDIQLIRDDEIIVFHDFDLRRMCGRNIGTNQISKADLKSLKLFESDQQIPLMEEVFEMVKGKVPLLIELKNKSFSKILETVLLKKISVYKGEFALQSFNPFSVKWLKENAPHIKRGLLGSRLEDEEIKSIKKIIPQKLLFGKIAEPDFIGFDIRYLPDKNVNKFRKSGIPILAWTVSDTELLAKAKKYADNFIFENIHPGNIL